MALLQHSWEKENVPQGEWRQRERDRHRNRKRQMGKERQRERQGETDGERKWKGNLLTHRSAFHRAFRGREASLPTDLTVRQWVVWSGQVKWHKQRLEVNSTTASPPLCSS